MKPGFPYSGQIVTAIRESRGLVLVLTPVANQSPDVLGEVTNAQNARKLIVPLVVQGTQPSDDLIYFLAMRQQFVWTDAKSAAAVLGEVFKQERGAVSMSEVDTKLVLARGCISIGDADGALEILVEVLHEGSASQKQEAQQLIETLSL
jgi:FimV-like protein